MSRQTPGPIKSLRRNHENDSPGRSATLNNRHAFGSSFNWSLGPTNSKHIASVSISNPKDVVRKSDTFEERESSLGKPGSYLLVIDGLIRDILGLSTHGEVDSGTQEFEPFSKSFSASRSNLSLAYKPRAFAVRHGDLTASHCEASNEVIFLSALVFFDCMFKIDESQLSSKVDDNGRKAARDQIIRKIQV
jgi:hypothetical protein